jgi:hypothetical protein
VPDRDALEILREKVAHLQREEALESGGAQRFELKQRIE